MDREPAADRQTLATVAMGRVGGRVDSPKLRARRYNCPIRAMLPRSSLDQPREHLAGLKPVEAIERGQLDLVWQVAEGLRSGSLL